MNYTQCALGECPLPCHLGLVSSGRFADTFAFRAHEFRLNQLRSESIEHGKLCASISHREKRPAASHYGPAVPCGRDAMVASRESGKGACLLGPAYAHFARGRTRGPTLMESQPTACSVCSSRTTYIQPRRAA